jgi:hypothetical protein
VATDIELDLIVVNKHQLKNTTLRIPVPIKYLQSASRIFRALGLEKRRKIKQRMAARVFRTATLCIEVSPAAVSRLRKTPVVAHSEAARRISR